MYCTSPRRSRRLSLVRREHPRLSFFFFNDTATTEIYTLSLHDALPISRCRRDVPPYDPARPEQPPADARGHLGRGDRKSTRLNSSHGYISYAVFCLKKKNTESYGNIPKVARIAAYPHPRPRPMP